MTDTPRRAYLHIGTFRTASTAYQTAIIGGRKILRETCGIHVVQTGTKGFTTAHHALAQCLRNQTGTLEDQELWSELRQEIGTVAADAVLLSSEEFGIDVSANIERVRTFFESLGYSLRALVVFRNQVDYLNSDYCEALRQGKVQRGMKEFIEAYVCDARFMYYDSIVSSLDAAGVEVSVVSFDRHGARTVEELLTATGGAPATLATDMVPLIVNPSVSGESVALLRMLYALDAPESQSSVREGIFRLQAERGLDTRYFGIQREEVLSVMSKFAQDNYRLLTRLKESPDFFHHEDTLLSRPYTSDEEIVHRLVSKLGCWQA